MSEQDVLAPDMPVIAVGASHTNGIMWRHSENLGKLAESLAKAQLAFKPVKKQTENTFYFNEKTKKRAMYADLAAIIEATQPALAENQLVVIQVPVTRGREAGVISRLQHSSNQFTECELYLPATGKSSEWNAGVKTSIEKFDAQTIGAAVTYARRYTYGPTIGIAAEEDDDANSISEPSGGSREAAQSIATAKIAEGRKKTNAPPPDTNDVTKMLFYTWDNDEQRAYISGAKELMESNRELLLAKCTWDAKAKVLKATDTGLEDLKFELGQRGIPFKGLNKASGK
jgi:hypothetical protein